MKSNYYFFFVRFLKFGCGPFKNIVMKIIMFLCVHDVNNFFVDKYLQFCISIIFNNPRPHKY